MAWLRPARRLSRAQGPAASEGEYYNFCLDHVREYNKSYNYFAGMERRRHRRLPALRRDRPPADLDDGRQERRGRATSAEQPRPGRRPSPIRSASSAAPSAAPDAEPEPKRGRSRTSSGARLPRSTSTAPRRGSEIKARYKALVKRLHPDANGGDRSLRGPPATDHPSLPLPASRPVSAKTAARSPRASGCEIHDATGEAPHGALNTT